MNRYVVPNLTLYGFVHALVDASCAALIFSLLRIYPLISQGFISIIILYNLLAFGTQPLLGVLVDKMKMPKQAAILGTLLVALSFLFLEFSPFTAITLAGIGNALFHIGGGTISLNLTPKRASAPGIFVAPGAIGLLIGGVIGKSILFASWYFIVLLVLSCFFMFYTKIPSIDYRVVKPVRLFELILLLVLLSIVARSLVGSVISLPWKSNTLLLLVLTMAVFLGKSLGGILGDRFGWTRVAVTALVLSAPMLAFGSFIPYVAIVGLFLFNMTMPITLTAISNTLPGRPGFSFGLTCLALIVGAYLSFLGLHLNAWTLMSIILLSALSLFTGLRRL